MEHLRVEGSVLKHLKSMYWFEDHKLVKQFPWTIRTWAYYANLGKSLARNRVPGGSFLLRQIRRFHLMFGMSESILIEVQQKHVQVRMFDTRLDAVVEELRGQSRIFQAIEASLQPGDTFLDVGANHGSYSVLASKILGDSGKLCAFEPFEKLAACVEVSLRQNATCDWKVLPVGLADKRETIDFFYNATGSGTGSIFHGYSPLARNTCSVQLDQLDSLEDAIDPIGNVVIKLDIEGSELRFLRGAENFISKHQPTIVFEANPASSKAAGYEVRDLIDAMQNLGYQNFLDTRQMSQPCSAGELDTTEQADFVAIGRAIPKTLDGTLH